MDLTKGEAGFLFKAVCVDVCVCVCVQVRGSGWLWGCKTLFGIPISSQLAVVAVLVIDMAPSKINHMDL